VEKIEKVNLIEVINSWQGEGPDCGKRMLILRFKNCNKKCKWCDTLVKMRAEQEFEFSLQRVQEIINEEKVGLLITGGEPTFGKQFEQTVAMLNYLNYPYANIESNGLKLNELMERVNTPPNNIKFIYSPKIFSEEDYDHEVETIKKFYDDPRLYVKIVYEKYGLVPYYLEELDKLNIHNKVFLMPKGASKSELLQNAPEVFDVAEKHKFSFSSRTHVIYSFV
jgi:7-carboxy-7-deazaguanine synthase